MIFRRNLRINTFQARRSSAAHRNDVTRAGAVTRPERRRRLSGGLIALTVLALGTGAASLPDDFRQAFVAVTAENFDSGGAISRQFHLNASSYLTTATIARTTAARELNEAPHAALADLRVRHRFGQSSFADYVEKDPLIDGVIVLHGNDVAFEAYPAMERWQRHFSWSVTKVLTATAVAALAHQGRVDMETPVEQYVSALAGTNWAGTSIRDIANMASGMDCLDSDGYQEKTTCIYRMEETLGITAPTAYSAGFLEHIRAIRRHRKASTKNEYVSANTNVLMLVIESVTRLPFAAAVQVLIWDRIGPEADALMAISDEGYAYASGGLVARLRDVARFGQVYTARDHLGVLDDALIDDMQGSRGIPLDKEDRIELIDAFGADLPVRAAWQWDLVWEDGGMYKGGYSGQGLYVDPDRRLVVAWFGTGEDFDERHNELRSIARQIARSDLFEAR